jgi:hypothetical protein
MKSRYASAGNRSLAAPGSLAVIGSALLVAVAACGSSPSGHSPDASVPPDVSIPDDSSAPAAPSLLLQGCTIVSGDRPASSSASSAPQLAHLAISAATPGQKLSGTAALYDPSAIASKLIVQVRGATEHLACPLSVDEVNGKSLSLERLMVATRSTAGSYLVYFGIQDSSANVGGYAIATVDVGAPVPIQLCASPGVPVQIVGRAPSEVTAVYAGMNGAADYTVATTPALPLVIVRTTRLFLDVSGCSHLLLASDAAGTVPVGWDNYLLVEYRTAPGATLGDAWYYGSTTSAAITNNTTQKVVAAKDTTTVPGTSLDPQVPNAAPFGYPPLTIDLLASVPAGSTTFELTLDIADYSGAGSTTDVWIVPQ